MERRAIQTPDGRVLRVYDAGDPAGPAILYHHGTPSSGLLDEPWIEEAWRRGARLIGFDRPGYGGSTERPGGSVADVAGDVAAILDELGVDRCATWGSRAAARTRSPARRCCPSGSGPWRRSRPSHPTTRRGSTGSQAWARATSASSTRRVRGGETLDRLLTDERDEMMAAGPDGLVDAMRPHLSPVDAAFLTGRFAGWLYDESRVGIGESISGWRDDDYAFLA